MNKIFEAKQFAWTCERDCYLRVMCFAQNKTSKYPISDWDNEIKLFLEYFEGRKLVLNYDEVMDKKKGLTWDTPKINFNFEYMHKVTTDFILNQGFKRIKRGFKKLYPKQRYIAYTPSPCKKGAFHFSAYADFESCLKWLNSYGFKTKDVEIYVEEPRDERWAIMRKGGITPIMVVNSEAEASRIVGNDKYSDLLFVTPILN